MAEVLFQPSTAPRIDRPGRPQNPPSGFGGPSVPAASNTHDAVGFRFSTSPDTSTSPPFPMDALPAPSFVFPAASDRPSGSRHRKHMSLALPAFDFNPSAASDNPTGSARSAPSPSEARSPSSSAPQSSPSRNARHVRAQSELPGNGGIGLNAFQGTAGSELEKDDSSAAIQASPTRRGHRHRRSGAVSSQDLSAMAQAARQSGGADVNRFASPTASASGYNLSQPPSVHARPGADFLRSAAATPTTSKSSSPVRVSFRNSIEVIPQRSLPSMQDRSLPTEARLIHSSDGRDGVTQLQPEFPAETVPVLTSVNASSWFSEDADDTDLTVEPSQAGRNVFSGDISLAASEEPPIGNGFSAMPGSFTFPDNMDGVDDGFGEPGFETVTEDFDGITVSEAASPSPMVSSPAPWNLAPRRSEAESSTVLDLDSAMENDSESPTILSSKELRSLRGKSFSAARHSMHSSGLPSDGKTPLHRRTESAPNLPSFDRPAFLRLNSASASDKGFEMENVFEEDEEEMEEGAAFVTPRTIPSTPMTADPPRTPLADIQERLSSDAHPEVLAVNLSDITASSDSAKATHSAQTGSLHGPAIRDSMSTITPELLSQAPGVFGEAHSTISSPPATPGASCGTRATSTSDGCAGDNISSHFSESSSYAEVQQLEPPRRRFQFGRLSSDGASSRLSSPSTIASGGQRQNSATVSPLTAEYSTMEGPPSRSGSMNARWRKRASLVSLSRLMSSTGSGRSQLSEEYIPRCQTSDGLGSEAQPMREVSGKRKRLSRLLHIFKPSKDGRPEGNG